MELGKEAVTACQSFFLGLGVVTALYFDCNWQHAFIKNYNIFGITSGGDIHLVFIFLYCCVFYMILNIILYFHYHEEDWQISVRSAFLGAIFGGGIIWFILMSTSFKPFGYYICILSFFHFSEYISTAIFNPSKINTDLFLLNHSISYWMAAMISWTEFFLERFFFPSMKEFYYITAIGIIICLIGECTRKLAMVTARSNFNHIVQSTKQEGHKLVTSGIYSIFRHPSYVGWFWWSIGTQIVLVNPFCIIAYALASWMFFNSRIAYEEVTLVKFFGQKYIDYRKKVGTGLPFVKGYVI